MHCTEELLAGNFKQGFHSAGTDTEIAFFGFLEMALMKMIQQRILDIYWLNL